MENNSNFMQVIPDSHYFGEISHMIEYVKNMQICDISDNAKKDLLIALENTKKNGFILTEKEMIIDDFIELGKKHNCDVKIVQNPIVRFNTRTQEFLQPFYHMSEKLENIKAYSVSDYKINNNQDIVSFFMKNKNTIIGLYPYAEQSIKDVPKLLHNHNEEINTPFCQQECGNYLRVIVIKKEDKKEKMNRKEIYQHIDQERDYQDERWNSNLRNDDVRDEEKHVAEWLNYIEYHLNKAKELDYHLNKEQSLSELRKIAALAVRCMEIHGCPERYPNKIQ